MNNTHLQVLREDTPLDSDDRHRMTRLYEEVLTRLEEMAMITARVLGMTPWLNDEVLFKPVSSGERNEFKAVALVRGPEGSGCYDYSRGSCFEYQPHGKDSE